MTAVRNEACVMVITDVRELKRPCLAENHSHLSQIAGVVLMNGLKDLSFCDTSSGNIRIGKIAHHPERKTLISNLEIIGKPERFQPFTLRTGLPRKEQILVTDPNATVVCLLNPSEYAHVCRLLQHCTSYEPFIFH